MTGNTPKKFHFDRTDKGPKKFMKLREPSVDLDWEYPEQGIPLELVLQSTGETTVVFPFPYLFEESHPDDPDRGQIFKLGPGQNLVLTVRPKSVIEKKFADEDLATPSMDGTVEYALFIFDHAEETIAEKDSPPPIKLGP